MTDVLAMSSRHAVTGVAIANCLGAHSEAVFARAFAAPPGPGGPSGFRPATDFFAFPFETELGVMALDVASVPTCAPTRIARIAFASARHLQAAVSAARERWGPRRVAYVFASSTGGLEHTEQHLAPLASPSGVPYVYGDHAIDATVTAFADHLGALGPRVAVSTACSSSLKALATAARTIDAGLADAAVVGCADSLCRTTIFGFHGLGLLDPTATRPFALHRRGLTLGEGSAYVLIERATSDTAAGALGWVAGVGASSDAYHQTSPHPDGIGAELAMRAALARAGLDASDIDLISAHATGTRLNDAIEGAALGRVFGAAVPITATKSLTGHTLGSSGLTAVVLALESLRRHEIPATLRADPVDPSLDLNVIKTPTPAALGNVMVNAFGFGGNNASVVVSAHGHRQGRGRA